jgi:serine/threonine protein kinase
MFSVESESNLDAVVEEELSDPSPRKIREDGNIIFKSRGIVTGDIQYPTICDFGEARFGKDEYEEHAMPDLYRAPEILLHTAWTSKIDIWALGLTASLSVLITPSLSVHLQLTERNSNRYGTW